MTALSDLDVAALAEWMYRQVADLVRDSNDPANRQSWHRPIPPDITDWSVLHEYTDANELLIDMAAEFGYQLFDQDGNLTEAMIEAENNVTSAVDRMLRGGRLMNDLFGAGGATT